MVREKQIYTVRIGLFFNLTHTIPLVSFYTNWKYQETSGFLMFLGGIETERPVTWNVKGTVKGTLMQIWKSANIFAFLWK